MVTLLRPLPERLAGLGVVMLGLCWGLAVAIASRDQILATELPLATALALTCLGGTLTVAGVWLGAGAVSWAMGRLLGGKAGLVRVLLALSAALPPLWIAAPALSSVLSPQALSSDLSLGTLPRITGSDGWQWVHALLLTIGGLALLGFVRTWVLALGRAQSFSYRRALGCAALTMVFCASYLSLNLPTA